MTVICGGGASAAKPGFNQTVVITSAAVEGALTLLGLEVVAAILAPFIAGETYDLTTFCTVDPPADPGLTGSDLLDLTNYTDPTVSLPAILKVQTWFKSWYWYQVCQCSTTTTPAAPTPSNPGSPSTNPGLPNQSNNPCFSGSYADTINSSVTPNINDDLTAKLLPINGAGIAATTSIGPFSGVSVTAYPIPAGIQSVKVIHESLAYDSALLSTEEMVAAFSAFNSSGTQLGGASLGQASNPAGPSTTTLTPGTSGIWPSGTTYYGIYTHYAHSSHATNKPQTLSFETTVQCTSGQLGAVCCPPDPLIENKLNQILGMLSAVFSALPSPLHSYAVGTVHSGLSGSGTISLAASTIAVKVNVTTLPTYLGEIVGSPITILDAGWLTPANTQGPTAAQRLTYSTQVFEMPSLPVALDYTLAGGLVVAVTELSAGP